jgi:hypothetical protein
MKSAAGDTHVSLRIDAILETGCGLPDRDVIISVLTETDDRNFFHRIYSLKGGKPVAVSGL